MSVELVVRRSGGDVMASEDPTDWDPSEGTGLAWYRIERPTDDDLSLIFDRLGIGDRPKALITGPELNPQFETAGEWLAVVIHGLALGDDGIDTHQITCLVRRHVMVTVSNRPSTSVQRMFESVRRSGLVLTESADDLLGRLTMLLGRRYLGVVDELDRRIDDLYERALVARHSVLSDIQVQRQAGATIHKVLRRQRLMLQDLLREDPPVLSKRGEGLLTDGLDIHSEALESLTNSHELLADALDTYRGAAAERQAVATVILAVYSAILLPLTLMTGFYGMNVGLPGQHDGRAWVVITAVMLLIAGCSVAVFVKAGFIRVGTRPERQTQGEFSRAVRDSLPTPDEQVSPPPGKGSPVPTDAGDHDDPARPATRR